jgi:hypothetical protein
MQRRTLAAVAAAATVAASLAAVSPAAAASPDVVISQVYGGGGNAGATFTNDFIELANNGGAAVDLTGQGEVYWEKVVPEVFASQGQITVAIGALTLDATVI